MAHWLEKVLELLSVETSDLRELARIAGADPKTFYRGINRADVDTNGQDVSEMDFGIGPFAPPTAVIDEEMEEIVAEIGAARRQEERLAIFLQKIESNIDLLPDIFDAIESLEQAKLARAVIALARVEFSENMSFEPSSHRTQTVARLMRWALAKAFPMSRGILLFYFAKHLGHDRLLRQTIRDYLNKSRSMFLDEYRSQIDEMLSHR